MSFGIEAVELYIPRPYVDLQELCMIFLIQRSAMGLGLQREEDRGMCAGTHKFHLRIPGKILTQWLLHVLLMRYSPPPNDEEKRGPSIASGKIGNCPWR
jgi:hypothetical protein